MPPRDLAIYERQVSFRGMITSEGKYKGKHRRKECPRRGWARLRRRHVPPCLAGWADWARLDAEVMYGWESRLRWGFGEMQLVDK